MRYILGLCVVLAAANLTGMVERAHGFQAAGRSAGQAAATTAENAAQQTLLPGSTTTQTPVTSPTITNPVPQIPGTGTSTPAATTTAPTNVIQTPAVPGTVTNNPVAGAMANQGLVVPGTSNTGVINNPTSASNYVPAIHPGTTPSIGAGGLNAVNPMATTMPIGSYTSGAGVGPTGMLPGTTYSSRYVTPGYTNAGQTYYTTPTQTYPVRQRRGLFGGMFRRRNRQVYTTAPTTYTYGTVPGTYSYVPAPY